jgi:hypothetical protein
MTKEVGVQTDSELDKRRNQHAEEAPSQSDMGKSCDSGEKISLKVIANAVENSKKVWEAIYDTTTDVRVEATTTNETSAVEWTGGKPTGNSKQRDYPRNNLGEIKAIASLPTVSASLKILVVPELISLTVKAPAKENPPSSQKYKAYIDGKTPLVVEAKTNPDNSKAWGELKWSDNGKSDVSDGDNGGQKKAKRDSVKDYEVKAEVKSEKHPQAKTASLHICQLPVLKIADVTFKGGNFPLVKDNGNPFPAPEWKSGRLPDEMFPVCYKMESFIEVDVTFDVDPVSTDKEKVAISGTATVGGVLFTWKKDIDVDAGVKSVSSNGMKSDKQLAKKVNFYDGIEITWKFDPATQGATDAGKSKHDFYVNLKDPTTTIFWTLIDFTCESAKSAGNVDSDILLIDAVNSPFKAGVAGTPIKRTSDGKELKYWGKNDPAQNSVQDFLQEPDGCGSCKAWSFLLIDSFKVHGVDTGQLITVQHTTKTTQVTDQGSLVHLLTQDLFFSIISKVSDPLSSSFIANNTELLNMTGLGNMDVTLNLPNIFTLMKQSELQKLKTNPKWPANYATWGSEPSWGDLFDWPEIYKFVDGVNFYMLINSSSLLDNPTTEWYSKTELLKKYNSYILSKGGIQSFLVKEWIFSPKPPSSGTTLTHTKTEDISNLNKDNYCTLKKKAVGQNNTDPPPVFENHFIVKSNTTNKFYDPSYGAGPFDDQTKWEEASIDGLTNGAQAGFDRSKSGGDLLTFS